MQKDNDIQIISFYEFKDMGRVGDLVSIKLRLKELLAETGVRGTIILAGEGFNASVCGTEAEIQAFISAVEAILDSKLNIRSSFHDQRPLRKIDVKIKPEIVTLKKQVDISRAVGTHVEPADWNKVISDEDTFVLDTRNDYEYRNGTFKGAVNPQTAHFSELPVFVEENLDPAKHKRVAMFCTGGIRCEKFAPYLKQIGFHEVFQLSGGILRYLAEISPEDSLWEGECFVFDERITLNADLEKGTGPDHSQRHPQE